MIELDVMESSRTENISSAKHLDGFEMSTNSGARLKTCGRPVKAFQRLRKAKSPSKREHEVKSHGLSGRTLGSGKSAVQVNKGWP